MNILVTGGLGYIGSHTCVALLQAGYSVVIVDNLSNAHVDVLGRIEQLVQAKLPLIIQDVQALSPDHLIQHQIEAVIHFAGYKSVAESVQKPLAYYQNNVLGSLHLLQIMQQAGIKKLIFSSSATVYAESKVQPLQEHFRREAVNPYGRSKLMVEHMMEDLYQSDPEWALISLRYFNPVGAHPSALIGEQPKGKPENLMPYLTQVAAGLLPKLYVFGSDYPTPDGTPMRDYIHVMDLAQGHVQALNALQAGYQAFNLGTGRAYSVLEMIQAFEQVNGIKIPYELAPRRAGDLAAYYADPSLAQRVLNWQAKRDLASMCRDSWRWQQSRARSD